MSSTAELFMVTPAEPLLQPRLNVLVAARGSAAPSSSLTVKQLIHASFTASSGNPAVPY